MALVLGGFRGDGKQFSQKIQIYVGCGLIILIGGLRFDIGYDYYMYYLSILNGNTEKYLYTEPISGVILYLGYLTQFPPLSFFIFSTLTYVLVIRTLYKYSDNLGLSLLIYFCLFFISSFSTIRQALGVAIIFSGYGLMKEKRFIRYFLLCLVGCLAHNSAIVGIIIYVVYNYIKPKYLPVIVVVLSLSVALIFNLVNNYLPQYTVYVDSIEAGADTYKGGSKMQYFYLAFNAFILFVARIWKTRINWNLFAITLMGAFVPLLMGNPHLGMRVADYFNIYLCLFVPMAVVKAPIFIKCSIISLVAALFLLTIYISSISRENDRPLTPYKSVFEVEDFRHPPLKYV